MMTVIKEQPTLKVLKTNLVIMEKQRLKKVLPKNNFYSAEFYFTEFGFSAYKKFYKASKRGFIEFYIIDF